MKPSELLTVFQNSICNFNRIYVVRSGTIFMQILIFSISYLAQNNTLNPTSFRVITMVNKAEIIVAIVVPIAAPIIP